MNNEKKYRKREVGGFTLIEILVALVVATLLFFGGYTSYREFSRRQALENSYKELRSNLNLAYQRALSGEKPTSCTGVLQGYRVDIWIASMGIYAVCPNMILVKQFSFPGGISISGPENLLFKVLGQGTNLSSNYPIVITQTGTGKQINAFITKEGVLERQ